MKPFIFILLLSLLGISNAQHGNHLVVQGFDEQINNITVPFIEARNKTVYYDIDFNNYEIEVNTIKCPSIKYNYYGNPPTASRIKISSGYQSISNAKGDLLGFVFNNILYSKNGDSIDYIPQYGGRRGIASYVGVSDTFTLYFIRGKKDYNATSFERQLYKSINQPYPPYPVDSFFLMESKYCGSKLISKNRIKGFKSLGKYTNLQSNVVFFNTKFNERKVQFVWDKFLYEVNISNDYSINIKQVLFNNAIDRNYFIWFDYQGGMSTPCELVVSPSGRWTVFNWYYSHFVNNTYKYSNSKVLIIDNENNLKSNEIVNDSGNNNMDKFTYWKNAVFTKNDSICLVRQIELSPQIGSTSYRDVVKILEVKIHENYNEKQYYNIKLDSVYTGSIFNNAFDPISDLMLAPNGKNYSFISKYVIKKSADGDSLLFVQFEIAEFIKNGTDYMINSPLLVLEGINMDYFRLYPFSNFDKIYFPATPIPYHYISFTNKSLCNDLSYEFTNETDTNWFDHFMWFWGDGDSSYTDKSQTVIRHQYKQPGKYRVLLKSITASGGWVWYSDSVEILPEPIAKYQTENTVGCQWIAVEFTDSSILENKAHTWAWDFGDGNDTLLSSTSSIMPTKRSIKHTYITSGQFQVQLRVSDGRCTDTFSTTQNIDILPAPRPGIAIDHILGCTPLEVNFGRRYSDPTDSTIYLFRPALVPDNHFDKADNSTVITQSGGYVLHQKLYGPSGCITQDSVALFITSGVPVGYQPILKRSTVINNQTTLSEWMPVPHAMSYQVYRNGMPHAVVNDTQFFDYLTSDINQSYTYEVQAIDSCDRRVANKSNMGKTIYLEVNEREPASNSEFATALLTWSPYEDWSFLGGVGTYESYGNYQLESESWERLSKNQDTTVNDNDFIKPKNYEKCYYVKAQSAQGSYESKSNVSCLKYQATLFAPNAFTPNGDGLNDVFEVFNYGFDRFTLSIYNSWGQKIYEQNNTEGIWAPTDSVPQGVYLYRIKAFRKNQVYEFSSTVTLLR